MPQNLCENPYLAFTNDGWYVNGAQASPVDLSDFPRPKGVRVTGATSTLFAQCPKFRVVPGVQYTGSTAVRPTWTGTVRTYLDYWNESGASIGDSGATVQNVTTGAIAQVGSTATVPSGTTHASLSVYVNLPTAGDQLDIAMHRFDTGADLTYYDGNSPGWQWIGPPGQSRSESVAEAKVWTGSAWVDAAGFSYSGSVWIDAPTFPGSTIFPDANLYPRS